MVAQRRMVATQPKVLCAQKALCRQLGLCTILPRVALDSSGALSLAQVNQEPVTHSPHVRPWRQNEHIYTEQGLYTCRGELQSITHVKTKMTCRAAGLPTVFCRRGSRGECTCQRHKSKRMERKTTHASGNWTQNMIT